MAYIKKIWKDYPDTTTPITAEDLNNIEDGLAGVLDWIYPVGTIYETTSVDLDTTTKMDNHFGGTWEAYGSGRVLVAKSADTEFDTIGETGGSKTHTLTVNEMPRHAHFSSRGINAAGNLEFVPYSAIVPSDTGGATTRGYGAVSSSTGNNAPHNNLQPYIVVYRYRRTA